ncbi:NADH:flavin oxidoreductase/NADH oxidase [Bosea sp. (in: a-proteobacteria)]|jgi:2,4-dienoyl-CoA reductase-like NADH-dependent reductase (Old Yellow Enzyme family)|uniref:NADH:flavin oxidoreductase/NADH oxidase n=1 Tax=Bosea sp. (in: a-proteobacteria) TaxID=1871050 RepID=UPI003F6FFE4D
MPGLFDPFDLKSVTLRNRIVASPMCQYSAEEGVVNEWHRAHLAGLARGGSGLVVIEATGVSPEGRITPGCLGLWNDAQAAALAPAVEDIRKAGAVAGIQIGHAGRKASANKPWEGDDHIPESDPRGWETIAPSAIAQGGHLGRVPRAMTKADIERVQRDFVAAAERARDIGIQWLKLHFAHGYLAQSFLSRHANQREDAYGGSFENRSRFLVETLAAIRKVWPEDRPLSARLGVIEYDGHDEETVAEAIALVKRLKAEGLDFIDVSVGFSTNTAKIPWGPAFLAPVAERVRREAGLPASTSWFISRPEQADAMVREGKVDLVTLGRPLLADPHWPYAAAQALGVADAAWKTLPAPYAHWLSRYRVA